MVPPFVDVAWLTEAPGVVLADVRWYLDGRSGRAAYDAGHLPGAVFVDLDRWLAAPATERDGRHPLPTPEVFAEGLASTGIGDDDVVVAYDDAGGVTAARLVWMLRATGRRAALLDGGLLAWDGPLEQSETVRPRAKTTAVPWLAHLLAGADEAADPPGVLLDARDRARYAGGPDPVDPRSGHVPGARNLPCRDNVGPDGRLLPLAELSTRLDEVGATDGTAVISSCGSGVTACHTLLVLEATGRGPGRLYPGSWSQWSRDPARPVAVGDRP